MSPITNAKINDATNTKIELFCSSLYLGHETLLRISSMDSFIKIEIFNICFILFFLLHGWRDSNSQPMVLETTTLPIELHPFIHYTAQKGVQSYYNNYKKQTRFC